MLETYETKRHDCYIHANLLCIVQILVYVLREQCIVFLYLEDVTLGCLSFVISKLL